MKKMFLILFSLVAIFASAQNNLPQPGDNILNTDMDKFIGTWKWKMGNDSFILILKKENIAIPFLENIRGDWGIGFHQYILNETIIEDSSSYSGTNYDDKKNTVTWTTDRNTNNPNILKGFIQHKTKGKSVEMTI
ncbi:hypothetical protein NAL32_22030 [Chryseobacterium sp. Ch-15]|uniref:DUF6705 domain-containing protein n=1 Tax=Chryseobacterium muglaense TaxID=2893752 RepID=A0A9Q3UXF5_9FLAO|nr:DUF6705 family protein [Chryseobacterium muglaense]MBD3907356.1 hypothetical protein [Chryseobacterium muglaense]MCC9035711.1 hypothetical protein [Chryseobacterium muglaense]MCM2557067.1 hypothetical protein [Chryseobacterium muglaense]